ncbi:MAG: DegT/DnrJ/EryC1/StrS family aminotransferase [Anaerolineaceae bacterium]|nr:DegT/DnrJ/EryC1/StrS family aminotransferase [Anaerolineaceae bacterium]
MINIAKPLMGAEEKQAVLDVLDSGMIACGSVVSEFEKEFAAYLGAEYCIATTSGTTALEVGLRSLGIGTGDTVITTPFSFIASTNSIIYTGATPVFAEINADTFLIDPASIEKAVADHPEAKALLIVHLFGSSCDMDAIMDIVRKHDLLLIEDCAQAHGAEWKGKKVGTFGNVGCFSFYPTKNMTTSEGGAVVTNDAETARKCRLLINHGMEVRYHHDEIGYNYRMTNICGAIGRCQLKKLDGFNEIRREHAFYLNAHIQNPLVETPIEPDNAKHVFHQYTVKVALGKRDAFVKHLEANGIGYGIFYPLSIPEQKCYADRNFKTEWPVTDKVKQQVVSLPIHPGLSEEDVAEVARVVNSFTEEA